MGCDGKHQARNSPNVIKWNFKLEDIIKEDIKALFKLLKHEKYEKEIRDVIEM